MRIAKAIAVGLLSLIAIYLLGAFVVWELNPALWDEHQRAGVIVFGVPLALTAALFAGFANAR